MANWEIVAGIPFFGPGLSSMSGHANSIRPIKTKQKPKRKTEKRTSNCYDFKLINLVLCVGLNIPISTRHYIILIGILSNENPCE